MGRPSDRSASWGLHAAPGQLQVSLLNTIDYHLNPQAALDAPRWQWMGGKIIEVEPEMPQDIVYGLRLRGHDVVVGNIQTMAEADHLAQ